MKLGEAQICTKIWIAACADCDPELFLPPIPVQILTVFVLWPQGTRVINRDNTTSCFFTEAD